MKLEDLQKCLDENTSWRKKELFQAQFLAENAVNVEAERYLCRVWVLMMYAHCDNFLKETTKAFLIYAKENSIANYNPNLMWLVLRAKENITEGAAKNYKSLSDYTKIKKDILFEPKLISEILNKRSFQYKSLRFFCDWVLQIEYDHGAMLNFCDKLKTKRDEVAHGEEAYIDKIDDCLPWNKHTLEFMDSLKDALISSLS